MTLIRELNSPTKAAISNEFLQVARDHFTFIRQNNLFQVHPIEGITAEIYTGDFHGLLQHLQLSPDFNHIQTAFNGYLSSLDFQGTEDTIFVISQEYLMKLLTTFRVKM